MTRFQETTVYGTVLIENAGGDHVSIIRTSRAVDDWFGAIVEICSDCWSGKMKGCSFMRGELRGFANDVRQLHRTLLGIAKLDPIEPNVTLTLTGDGKGHVRVEGLARNRFETRNSLAFDFEIDQTFLMGLAEGLERADPAD